MQANDTLIAVTQDGDTIVDNYVRQEFGMLISDKGRYATELVRPAPIYEFVDPQQPPMKVSSAFILTHDPPPPEKSARIMNTVGITVYRAAKAGQWKPKQPIWERAETFKYVICLMCVAAFLWVMYDTYTAEPPQPQQQVAVVEGPPPQPNYAGIEDVQPAPVEQQRDGDN